MEEFLQGSDWLAVWLSFHSPLTVPAFSPAPSLSELMLPDQSPETTKVVDFRWLRYIFDIAYMFWRN